MTENTANFCTGYVFLISTAPAPATKTSPHAQDLRETKHPCCRDGEEEEGNNDRTTQMGHTAPGQA